MDIELNYIEQGSGDYLIFLHGNGEDSSYFKHQLLFFSQNFHVIALDTRGHGKSPRGDKPFSIKQFSEDLHDFMVMKSIPKTHLLGFSDGGNIALEFVLKYPQFVDKLILNGANLNPKGVKRLVQWPVEISYKIANKYANKSEKAKTTAEMLGLMVNEPNIVPSSLHQIENDTLVIVGTNDMIKESHSRLIFNNLPNAQWALVKGNHFIANQHPVEFNRIVQRFLE